MKNYYDLLEISIDSSKEQIKDAYRKLAHKYHPDKNVNNTVNAEIFQSINEAKQVLFDEEKKAAYDVMLSDYLIAAHAQKLGRANPFTMSYSVKRSMANNVFLFVLLGIVLIGAIIFIVQTSSTDNVENVAIAKAAQNEIGDSLPSSALSSTLSSDLEAEKVDNNPSELKTDTSQGLPSSPQKIEPITEESKPAAPTLPIPTIEKTGEATKATSTLSASQMERITMDINIEMRKLNNASRCVTVVKASNSNVENAFELAKHLSNNGYTIAGRQTSNNNVQKVKLDASGGCMKVIIGAF